VANNKKVITLGLDYSQFDGGITEVNRKMGLLDSQFRLATEQTKAFGTETDRLTLKHDALTQKINLVTQKVNLSKEAYDKAAASGKTSDKQLDALQKTYIVNQTTLQKLNNELAENKDKLDRASKSSESFGDSIRGMASSLGINVSPALETVATKFDGLDKNVGNAVLGLGAIFTTFASLSISASNMADELLTLSSVTGITTDELQKMQYASSFLDVEVETMTGSMTKLTRNMDDARKGSKELDAAFDTLHVRYQDNNKVLLDSEQVFYNTIDALGRISNETERDALAMTVLGKSAKDLNPLIEAGSERLKELGIEAGNLGTVMSEEKLEKLGRLNDAMAKMSEVGETLKENLGLFLVPMLTALFETISKIPAPVLETIVVLATVIASITLVVKAIKSVTDTANVIGGFFGVVNPVTMKTVGIVMAVVAALIALVAIITVLSGKGGELERSMGSIGDSVGKINETVTNVPRNTAKAMGYASGTRSAINGYAWVGEAGPEIMKFSGGEQVINNTESKQLIGNTYYNITIDAKSVKDFNDVVRIAQNYRQTARQGLVPIG
jgi:hypothetical protein